MFHSFGNDDMNMIVGKGIIYCFTFLAVFYEACLFKNSELMGYCRLGHMKQFGYIADAHFVFHKSIKDLYAGGIAEHLEQFGKVAKVLVARQRGNDLVQDIIMYTGIFTVGCIFHFSFPFGAMFSAEQMSDPRGGLFLGKMNI